MDKKVSFILSFILLFYCCSGTVQESIKLINDDPEVISREEYEYAIEESRSNGNGGFLRFRGNYYPGDKGEKGETYFKYRTDTYSIRLRTNFRRGSLPRHFPFLNLSLGRGRFDIAAGDFIPAWGFGLISRAPYLSYPFSGRYFLKRSESVFPYTFLFGCRVRGIACNAKISKLDCFVFKGKLLRYSNDYRSDIGIVRGARFALGSNRIGISSYLIDYSFARERPAGIIAFLKASGLRAGCEVASCGNSISAFEFRLGVTSRRVECGLRLSRKNKGYSSRLGGILTRNMGRFALQEGFEFILRRSFSSRTRCYFFVRRYLRDENSKYTSTEVNSLFVTSGKKATLKLLITYRAKESFKLLPYPRGDGGSYAAQLKSYSLVLKSHLIHHTKISGKLGYRATGDKSGLLLSANIGISLPVKGLSTYLSAAKIVPIKGETYGYYTPAYFPDIFPWRVISGKEFAQSCSCIYTYGNAQLACLIFFGSSGVYEGRLQFKVKL